MAYLLFFHGKLCGCYGKIDLVRFNILILLFRFLNREIINNILYDDLINYLEIEDFDYDSFNIPDLNSKLDNLSIKVVEVPHESNGSCALESILEHIKKRFDQLEEIMLKDARVKVTFPGKDAENHDLGPAYFKCWKLLDSDNYIKLTSAMYDYIASRIKTMSDQYPDRIKFGSVNYQNASPLNYQVWSANALNWNLGEGEMIPGDYQAKSIRYQEPGVFGIVVNPRYGYKNI